MIRDGCKVERAPQLRRDGRVAVLVWKVNGFSLRKSIRVRRVVSLARDVRVERVAGVNVQIAEERPAKRLIVVARFALLGADEGRDAGSFRVRRCGLEQ